MKQDDVQSKSNGQNSMDVSGERFLYLSMFTLISMLICVHVEIIRYILSQIILMVFAINSAKCFTL